MNQTKIDKNKVVIVLPAYNASKTLKRTLVEIPPIYAALIILVDDASTDNTVEIAKEAGIQVFQHQINRGYDGNQKTCFKHGLAMDADIIVLLHPDHQYDASVIPNLIKPIINTEADAVMDSRMSGGHPLEGGMPWWKYTANIFLTAIANVVFRRYLSEIHSGFRAYPRKYLETVRFEDNSNDFVFDTEIIAQGMACGLFFREIPIVTRYFPEASSINFFRSVKYGFGILFELQRFLLHRQGLLSSQKYYPKNMGV